MFATAMAIRLKEINNEIVKAPEVEVVILFNPLRSVVQIEDKLHKQWLSFIMHLI